jgi:hypothetical protein
MNPLAEAGGPDPAQNLVRPVQVQRHGQGAVPLTDRFVAIQKEGGDLFDFGLVCKMLSA